MGWQGPRDNPEPMLGLSEVKRLYPDADIEYVLFFFVTTFHIDHGL